MSLFEKKLVCGKKGSWFELKDLDISSYSGFECKGSLSCDGSSLLELPKNLYVEENLYIGKCEIHNLPGGLVVGGDLILLNSSIVELPADICVGGNIIALQVKNKPTYEKNTIYKNFICDNESKVFIFKNKNTFITRGGEAVDVYSRRNGAGYLARRASKQEFFHCNEMWEGLQQVERENLKGSSFYQKYINYDITEKRFTKELLQIFKEITGEEVDIDLIKENKYSIEEFCYLVQNSKSFYTFLFIDYFLHKEKFI